MDKRSLASLFKEVTVFKVTFGSLSFFLWFCRLGSTPTSQFKGAEKAHKLGSRPALRLRGVSERVSRGRNPGSKKCPELGAEKIMTATDVTGFDAIFSTGFFTTFSRLWGARLTKLHRKPGEQAKNPVESLQWRRRPEIADFCPWSWSNVSWGTVSEEFPESQKRLFWHSGNSSETVPDTF